MTQKIIAISRLSPPSLDWAAVREGSIDPQRVRWLDLLSSPGLLGALLLRVLAEQSWFIIVATAYLAAGFALAGVYHQRVSLSLYDGVHVTVYVNCILAIVIYRTIRCLVRHRPMHPIRFVYDELTRDLITPWRAVSSLPALVLVQFVLSMYSSMKGIIPIVAPFSWDPALAAADRFVHGGVPPWELLQPILGAPIVTYAMSLAYTLPWYVAIVVLQFWYTFSLNSRRMQFLITYVLCWSVIGTALAITFSSAGPVYYGYVVAGENPYAPLLATLDAVNRIYELPTSSAQAYLWDGYQRYLLRLGSGISAMPSMHISLAFLLVLVAWDAHRGLRSIAVGYLIIVMAGSVYLGWHYAIDGYVSIAATGVIWLAVSRALVWRDRRAEGLCARTKRDG